MAGDWIKIEHWTPDKPEVFRMAELLDMDPDAVTGKLIRIWIWADQQTITGDAHSVTRASLDRLTQRHGFADAMLTCGWLEQTDDGLRFVNFDRHNGETAKTRALNAKRNGKLRARRHERDAVSVTSASPKEEKRREDNTTTNPVVVEIQNALIRCGVTSAKAAESAIAAGGPERTLEALAWLEGQRVAGVLPFAPAVIYGRLTQAGRASLPASQGWDDRPSTEYLKAVEKSKQAARKLRDWVERIPIPELTARHGPWADGLDLSFERVKLERENQVWRMEPDSKVRVELMRRKEMEVRSAKAEAG